MNNLVSSAMTSWCPRQEGAERHVDYITWRSGQSTDPWGTPYDKGVEDEW